MARLPPSRHTLHRRLRLLDRRTRRHPPLRTTFLPAALATCHSRGLPTQRRHRSDPNATSRTRSPRCGGALSPPLPELSRDALVATRRSAKRQEFPITDAVRLAEGWKSCRHWIPRFTPMSATTRDAPGPGFYTARRRSPATRWWPAMDAVGVDGAVLVSPFSMYRYDASYACEVFAKHSTRFRLVKPVDPTDPRV